MPQVLFLNYHSIDIGQNSAVYHVDPVYSVREDAFRQQMALIHQLQLPVLSLPQYLEAAAGNKPLLPNSLIITFDDGFLTDYEVTYPILKQYGFSATFFICLLNIKSEDRWQQMQRMITDGYIIGSHTVSHRYLSDLSLPELQEELSQSKQVIEEKTGQEVKYLAPPGGRFNRQVIEAAQQLGYEALLTTRVGLNDQHTDCMQLKRWTVRYHTTLEEFELMIRQDKKTLANKIFKSEALNWSKRLLGNNAFDKLRQILLPSQS